MNPLNLSVLFHLLTALPGDFSYDRDNMKVVSSTDQLYQAIVLKVAKTPCFFKLGWIQRLNIISFLLSRRRKSCRLAYTELKKQNQ